MEATKHHIPSSGNPVRSGFTKGQIQKDPLSLIPFFWSPPFLEQAFSKYKYATTLGILPLSLSTILPPPDTHTNTKWRLPQQTEWAKPSRWSLIVCALLSCSSHIISQNSKQPTHCPRLCPKSQVNSKFDTGEKNYQRREGRANLPLFSPPPPPIFLLPFFNFYFLKIFLGCCLLVHPHCYCAAVS